MKNEYYVIDAHCHIGDPGLPDRLAGRVADNPRAREVFESFEGLQRDVGWMDGTAALGGNPANFPNLLRESGTDMAIFAMLGFGDELGGVEISSSEFLAGLIASGAPFPFRAYAGVDPRLPDGEKRRLIASYVGERGFMGIKINPNDWGGFPLDDERVMPIYEECDRLRVPVHVHTGYDPTGTMANGDPMLLEKVAQRWPNLTLLLEHYGFPWKYQAYAMCRKYRNVYLTLAFHFNALVHHNRCLAWQELEEMRIHAGIGKIIYGSDFPASPNMKEVIDFLKYARVPRVLRRAGYPEWTHEMRARVLGLNAARALGIRNERIERIETSFEKPVVRESSMIWDPDAKELLESIPPFVRKGAMLHIEKIARERGCRVVTVSVMEEARATGAKSADGVKSADSANRSGGAD